jgi:hypothetical protein
MPRKLTHGCSSGIGHSTSISWCALAPTDTFPYPYHLHHVWITCHTLCADLLSLSVTTPSVLLVCLGNMSHRVSVETSVFLLPLPPPLGTPYSPVYRRYLLLLWFPILPLLCHWCVPWCWRRSLFDEYPPSSIVPFARDKQGKCAPFIHSRNKFSVSPHMILAPYVPLFAHVRGGFC